MDVSPVVSSNIKDRFSDPQVDFKIQVKFKECKHLSFHDAADYTAHLIPKQKLFVALSGGADSEYVCRTLHRNEIKFTPIIVVMDNKDELTNAVNVCNELCIKPVVLRYSDEVIIKEYCDNIFKKLNGYGVFATPTFISGRYAIENDGILVTGDHHMDDGNNTTGIGMIEACEWEFYNNALMPGSTISFYNYTLEIFRALAKYDVLNFDIYKCAIYGIKHRNKSGHSLSRPAQKMLSDIQRHRKFPQGADFFMSKKEFLEKC